MKGLLYRVLLLIRGRAVSGEEAGEYSGGYWPHKVRQIAASVAGKRDGRLLEVGCGEGLFLEEVKGNRAAAGIFGLDNCRDLLLRAKARRDRGALAGVRLVLGDGFRLPFKSESFETAVCLNLIPNLATPGEVENMLKEVYCVCKPGARIMLDIRNSLNPLTRVRCRFAKYYDASLKVPLRAYRPGSIAALMEKTGFKTASVRKVGLLSWVFSPVLIFEAVKTGS